MSVINYHPRSLIRKALVKMFKKELHEKNFNITVFENRVSAFLAEDLPCIAVYAESENILDEAKRPNPNERDLSINIDLLAREGENIDDDLDALSYFIEKILTIEKLDSVLDSMFEADGLVSSDIVLIEVTYENIAMGLIADDARVLGCASMAFSIKYELPKRSELPDFNEFSFGMDMSGELGENGQGNDNKIDVSLSQKFETIE